jgi:hypothetical protein
MCRASDVPGDVRSNLIGRFDQMEGVAHPATAWW